MTCSAVYLYIASVLLSPDISRPELSVLRIPADLKKDAYAVVRESVTTLTIHSSKSYTQHIREAVTILDNRANQNVLTVGYDKYSKAKIHSAEIYDAAGELIRKVKKQEIRDVSMFDGVSLYSDNRLLVLDLPGGRVPYSIAYEYEVTYDATMMYDPWRPQEYHTAIEKAELHVIYPTDRMIHVSESNLPSSVVKDKSEGDVVHQVWRIRELPAVVDAPYAPEPLEVLPMVFLAPDRFEVEKYTGSMSDWKRFGAFIYEINQGRDRLTQEMASIVRSLVSDAQSDREKVDILYTYLKSNTRYVSVQLGIGGWQSYSAEYVEANKYGDCKALSYFMKGMLREADVEAYPVLIGWDRPSFMRDEIATPLFNHMMLYVPSEKMWLECTSTYNPTGYIHDGTSDRDVLLITPDGGVKARTPATAIDASAEITVDTFAMDSGKWRVRGHREYRGSAHDYYRYLVSYLSPTDREKRFRERCDLSIHKLHALAFSASSVEPTADCRYEMELAQYGSASGPRLFIPVVPMYRYETACKPESRNMEIHRNVKLHEVNTIVFPLPEGFVIEGMPAAKELSDPRFGLYSQKVTQSMGYITVHRELLLNRLRLPADAYAGLCAFYKEIEAADRNMLVLKREGP